MARRSRFGISYITEDYSDIHPEEIWDPGYPAYDWCKKVTAWLEVEAKRTAPGRPGTSHARRVRGSSGVLRAGITAFGHRTGLESYRLVLNSAAPYSAYVHGGTTRYIYSTLGYANREFIDANLHTWYEGEIDDRGQETGEGKFGILPIIGKNFMVLPPGAGFSRKYHLRVRGQLPNAFLYRAWNRTNEELADGEMGSFDAASILGYITPAGAVRASKKK